MKSLVMACFCMSSLVLAMDPQKLSSDRKKLSSSWPTDNAHDRESLQRELRKHNQQVDHLSNLLEKNQLTTEKLFKENNKQIEHNAYLVTSVYDLIEQVKKHDTYVGDLLLETNELTEQVKGLEQRVSDLEAQKPSD